MKNINDKNDHLYTNSPAQKKINYFEEDMKQCKRKRTRLTIDTPLLFDVENIMNNENFPINNVMNANQKSQCINNEKQFGIIDDLLNELNEEHKIKINNDGKPMANELNKLFQRNDYSTYFKDTKGQDFLKENFWNDFHRKRDKL